MFLYITCFPLDASLVYLAMTIPLVADQSQARIISTPWTLTKASEAPSTLPNARRSTAAPEGCRKKTSFRIPQSYFIFVLNLTNLSAWYESACALPDPCASSRKNFSSFRSASNSVPPGDFPLRPSCSRKVQVEEPSELDTLTDSA